MKRLVLICAGLTVLLGGCGAYLHDATLITPATTANARLTQAPTLAPFDDQLVKLAAFASEEDLAVASWWTAQRDRNLAALIAQSEWRTGIKDAAETRLAVLAPGLNVSAEAILRARNQTGARQADLQGLFVVERQVAVLQVAWADVSAGDTRKTDCPSLRTEITEAGATTLMQGATDRDFVLGNLVYACWEAEKYRLRLADLDVALASAGGVLAQANEDLRVARSPPNTDLSANAQELAAAIKAADAASKTGSAAQLKAFEERLSRILTPLSQAAQLAGWDHAAKEIDQLLRARVCSADAAVIEDALRTAANCDDIDETSTVGQEAAAWAFARAVAQLANANHPDSRSVQWLIAAKAIVAAEKADAQLNVDLAGKRVAAESQRVDALLREALALREAQAAADAVVGPGRSTADGCFGAGEACALALYAEGWNVGRIPAEVLRYRTIQLDREYAVRRARVVAGQHRALGLAGAASLQAYAEGGVSPETVAQLIFDLTLLGVVSD